MRLNPSILKNEAIYKTVSPPVFGEASVQPSNINGNIIGQEII